MSNILFPKYGGLTIEAFQEMCITVILISFILVLIACIAISEKDKQDNISNMRKSPVKIKDCFRLIKSNRALQAYIIAAASEKLTMQAASQTAITTMVFGIIIGNYEFNGILGMINVIPTIMAIFLSTRLACKIGTKKALLRWVWISISVAISIVIYMTLFNPTLISKAVIPTGIFIILFAMFSAAKLSTSACTGAMMPDIVDYEMSRSGNFMPAVVGTVYSFIDKLISSLATTIVGVCIAAIGYTTTMPQPGDASTPAVYFMTMFLWLGLPIIGWLFTVVAMKFYPLDREKMIEIQKINNEKRELNKMAN